MATNRRPILSRFGCDGPTWTVLFRDSSTRRLNRRSGTLRRLKAGFWGWYDERTHAVIQRIRSYPSAEIIANQVERDVFFAVSEHATEDDCLSCVLHPVYFIAVALAVHTANAALDLHHPVAFRKILIAVGQVGFGLWFNAAASPSILGQQFEELSDSL